MSTESSQKWLERNRPPRVQISYDVETGGASVKRELPMVVGIVADLGATEATMAERRFIEIDRDNFDQVMKTIKPTMQISGVAGLSGAVSFEKLEHFEPDHLVKTVDGLKQLFQQRQELRDLMAKMDGNDVLHRKLLDSAKAQASGLFADWGVKMDEEKPAAPAALATLGKEALAALAPAAFAAYPDADFGQLAPEQLAVLTQAQLEALQQRKVFTKAQIEALPEALRSLTQSID